MNEEEILYDALRAPLGLVVTGDRQRLTRARTKLVANDPAMHELAIIGPDRSGNIYLLRTDAARKLQQ